MTFLNGFVLCLTMTILIFLSPPAFARNNLIENPDFENGRSENADLPEHWELHEIEKKHISTEYVAENVSLVKANGRGKCLRFNLTKRVAEGPGIGFVSDWIKVDSDKQYEIKVDIKSYGPTPNIFCYCYAPEEGERKWVYRYPMFVKGASDRWQTFSGRFPTKKLAKKRFKPVKWVRIKLYAYYPQGEIFFDNVSLRVVGE